jgi:DNA ligase-1
MEMKPMLAATATLEKLRYPLLASPKLDGVRALVIKSQVWSRSLKLIPNIHVQNMFGQVRFNGWDGELIAGPPAGRDTYRRTVSAVMSEKGAPPVSFFVFDWFGKPDWPYLQRQKELRSLGQVRLLPQQWIHDEEGLLSLERGMLALGYEGLMLRSLDGQYKFGRSTEREGLLLKLKRFEDSEGVVIGFEELMHNYNPQKTNALGRTERSSHQEGKFGGRKLGALVVRWRGEVLRVGTGFNDYDRQQIWEHQSQYKGELVKFKYLPIGMKDLPRHPVFLGWRDRKDK